MKKIDLTGKILEGDKKEIEQMYNVGIPPRCIY